MSGAVARLLKRSPQSVWLVGSVGLNAVVSLFSVPLFVELLSREELATLAQAGGVALAVSTICSLGANTIGPHIASGKLAHISGYDELLGNQFFTALVLLALLTVAALVLDLPGETFGVFAFTFAAGVSSAVSPNWLMVQLGLAHRIFAFHVLGRLVYVGFLTYFAVAGGGLLLASAGMFAGSLLTTGLMFRCMGQQTPVGFSVIPVRPGMIRQAATVMSAPLATALFVSAAPFVLQSWIGLAATGIYYVVERARVFVSEIVRASEAPFYQTVAHGEDKPRRGDAAAMPLAAFATAAAFPMLAVWGPKLAVVQMLDGLWPYLSAYCLALALSTRVVGVYLDGQRMFGGGALLRIGATGVAGATLLALCAYRMDNAYAIAVIVAEVALTLAAVAWGRGRRG